MRSPLYACLCLAWCSWAPLPSLAASADQRPDLRHVVQQGDTLQHIAQLYLQDPLQWPELASLNGVRDPRRLPIGSVILIPKSLLSYQNATVGYLQGKAYLRSNSEQRWQPVTAGMTVTEGDEIQVAEDSYATLKLSDGSQVQISANSQLRLEQLRKNSRTQAQQSVIELQKGSVDSTVTPAAARSGTGKDARVKRRFEIKTPLATTSVRGTRFSVQLTDSGNAVTAVDHGVVAVDAKRTAHAIAVPAGSGLAVRADGRAGPVVRQLNAPNLQENPAVFEDANFLSIHLGAVNDAQLYRVVIAKDEALQQIVESRDVAQTTATLPGVPDGHYYLAARALDSQGIPSSPAIQAIKVKATPVPPLYQSPAPQGLIGTDDGELVCTPSAEKDVQAYHIQIAADTQFNQPLRDFKPLANCSTSLQGLPPGHYFWRTAAIRRLADGSLDPGPFAKPQAFRVGKNPQGMDANGIGVVPVPMQLQLSWPAEAGQQFNLQLSSSEQFDQSATEEHLDQPHWTSKQLAPGDYFVRIQVLDPSGLKSKYSAPRKLAVEPLVTTGGDLVLKTDDGKPVQSTR